MRDFLIKICQTSAISSLLGLGVLLSGFFGGSLLDDLLKSFLSMPDGLLGVSLSQDLLKDVDSLFGTHGFDHVSDGPLGSGGRLEGVAPHSSMVNNSSGLSSEDMSDLVVDASFLLSKWCTVLRLVLAKPCLRITENIFLILAAL